MRARERQSLPRIAFPYRPLRLSGRPQGLARPPTDPSPSESAGPPPGNSPRPPLPRPRVIVRTWSSPGPGAPLRMPGVTIRNSGPHRSRRCGVSSGEATTPSRPASCARSARAPPARAPGGRRRLPRAAVWSRLVSTVTAMTSGARAVCGGLIARRSRAARIIAAAAARVHVDHPRRRAAPRRARRPRRCSGCRGTSSRGTRDRRAPPASGRARALGGEQVAADLEAADVPAEPFGHG